MRVFERLPLKNSLTLPGTSSFIICRGSQESLEAAYPFHPTRTSYCLPFRLKSLILSTEYRIWSVISAISFILIGVPISESTYGLILQMCTTDVELSRRCSSSTVKSEIILVIRRGPVQFGEIFVRGPLSYATRT